MMALLKSQVMIWAPPILMQVMTIQQLLMNRPLTIMMIAPRTNPKNHLKQVFSHDLISIFIIFIR